MKLVPKTIDVLKIVLSIIADEDSGGIFGGSLAFSCASESERVEVAMQLIDLGFYVSRPKGFRPLSLHIRWDRCHMVEPCICPDDWDLT